MARKRTDKVLALANKADMILSSHFQSGNNEIIYKEFNTTIANLKTSANIFYPFVVITDVGKEGLFKYDSTDIISVNDDVYVIVDSSGRRWKRTSDVVNTKLQYVLTTSELQAFTQSTLCHYDGNVWEKKSGNVASNGGAYAGTLIRISSTTYWERQIIKYVTFEMFGAKGDGITDDYIPISNTLLNATNIFVSGKTFICSQAITQIQSNTTILGLGKKSEMKFTYIGENHFIAITNKQNILIDNIYINANPVGRLTGDITALQGGAIIFYNSEIAKTPRLNNITIQNCFIGSNGFNGIGAVNAHVINVFNNYFYGGRDSGIAATSGCSQWNIVGNHFEDTNQFPISLSNNGVTPADYTAVGLVRNCIIQGNFINVVASSGYGIELDGVDNIKVFDNIITINQNASYGIRLISSHTFANDFDVYNVDIFNNTIINNSTADRVGIEIYNDGTQSVNHNITVTENTITNQIESIFKGISLLNVSVKCSKNVINSRSGKYATGIALEVFSVNNGIEIDLSDNDISGGIIGVQTTNLTNQASLFLTRNKIYGNTVACLGLNTGWNVTFNQNLLTGDIYNSALTTKGDYRYYSAAPTTGTWLINEIVYNVNPYIGSYTGFICISGGTPGTWKGFGLIDVGNTKLETVTSIASLQAYTLSNYAYFDGSTWERKSGNVASNGGSYAGTIINVSSSLYWERKYDSISPKFFGAKEDGVTDDSFALQLAVDYAISIKKGLYLQGLCFITQSININRIVDGVNSDYYFYIKSSNGGGFVVNTAINLFSSSLPYANSPVSQMIAFEGITFKSLTASLNAYVLDGRIFLRVRFSGCSFIAIKCLTSTLYVQSIYFFQCNIRHWNGVFFKCLAIGYDVKFQGNLIEAGADFFDVTSPHGCSFIGNILEGLGGTAIAYRNARGFTISGNFFELNSLDIDGFTGNGSSYGISMTGNLFEHDPANNFYGVWWGDCKACVSTGNFAESNLHQLKTTSEVEINDVSRIGQLSNIVGLRYQDGTFTPQLRGGATGNYTTSNLKASYVKTGKLVEFIFSATLTSTANNTTEDLYIVSGIPFAHFEVDQLVGSVQVSMNGINYLGNFFTLTNDRIITNNSTIPANNAGDVITVKGKFTFITSL